LEIWISLQERINGKFGSCNKNNQWEIWISLKATINGKLGFRYRQQSMGNLDFVAGNNQ
jgi:hypothetical protein